MKSKTVIYTCDYLKMHVRTILVCVHIVLRVLVRNITCSF